MLADLTAQIWPALPMFFFAGLCFVLAGALYLFVVRRNELTLGPDPEIPDGGVEAIAPRHARPDSDTQIIAGIPGALPPQEVAVQHFANGEVTQVPVDHLARRPYVAVQGETIPGLRVIPSVDELWPGPVCNVCGGPAGACTCHIKNAPKDNAPTEVVDLCPLTTQDIEVPTYEPVPDFAETFDRHPRAELGTQELSGSLARAKERVA